MAEPIVKSDGSGGYTFSWNHCVNSPNMEVIGSVSSDGKYSVRFYKHGTGSFGYTYNIKVNGTSIFSYGVGDIKENVNIFLSNANKLYVDLKYNDKTLWTKRKC